LHDPYTGPTGVAFPGLTAANNEQLAKNLLKIVQTAARAGEDSWEDAYRLITSIEYNISRITHLVMSAEYGADWFGRGVAEAIRRKCAERAIQERKGLPPHAYLDILDYKKVWHAHWPALVKLMPMEKRQASNDDGVRFFEQLNEIRRLAMHATKQLVGERPKPTADELKCLQENMKAMRELFAVARQVLGNG
jgi:hypothetical protein